MATITLRFTLDETPVQLANSLGASFGYQPTINGQPNPETKREFVRRNIEQKLILEMLNEGWRAMHFRLNNFTPSQIRNPQILLEN